MKRNATNGWIGTIAGGLVTALILMANPAEAANATWGNTYNVGSSQGPSATTTTSLWASFTASDDVRVTQARLYSATIADTTELAVGLYLLGENGAPTGSALVSGTTVVPGGSASWKTVNFSGTANLTAGTAYAIVAMTNSGTFTWRVTTEPTQHMQPVGVSDDHWGRGTGNTVSMNGQFVWTLGTTVINSSIGQPYSSATAQNAASPTVTLGQRFVFDLAGAGGDANMVESIALKLGIGATGMSPVAAPSQPVVVKLISASGTVLATTSLDLSGETPGTVADFTFTLDSPVKLTDNEVYYIGLYSNGSAGNSVKWYGWNTENDPFYISSSFQGAEAYGVSWGSQSNYTGTPTAVTRDYYFALNLVTPIPEPSVAGLVGAGLICVFLRRRIGA